MIAAALTLYSVGPAGRLLSPLRSVHFAEIVKSDWFAPCAASALLPLVAVAIVVFLAVHFGG